MATSKRTLSVLITGASSGIGAALAQQYAKTTAHTLFICGRNSDRLQETTRLCEQLGCKVHSQILDVTDRQATQSWIEQSHRQTPLNLVIANAGTGTIHDTIDSIYQTFDTNLYGVLNTILPAKELYRQSPSE